MNPSTRPTTTRERDRALQRLRSITAGIAVLGTAATAGFGALAAVTWSGSAGTAGDDTAAAADPTANAWFTNADEDSDLLTGAEQSTPAPSEAAAPIQPNPTPLATTRKKPRVTSGGSG
ncbi:MAG TPA: hypothetical protein VJ850_14195 [Candidatus Limnocylindrales bacterium]|nr:hypothetical protein [Candidatus Limnocylindrales bacterium]